MPATLTPDIKRIVSDYLRTHASVTAHTSRVVAKPTDSTATPWVRVTRISGTSTHHSDYFVPWLMQFDCYAGASGGWPEAVDLARGVRKALMEIHESSHSGATITGAEVVGDIELPDPDVDEPARARVVITATVWAHG